MLCHSDLSEESVYIHFMYTDSSLSSFSPKISPISLHSCHQKISISGTEANGLQDSCNRPVSPARGRGMFHPKENSEKQKIHTIPKELILFKKVRIVF